jgi:GrpB-like predicted nucleotidyltransferase (UPF0157 family)
MFNKIREYIWPHIKDNALDIIHIGSTSVPGLAAKPIIDFIVIDSYDVFPQITEQLKSLGYEHDGDGGIPKREVAKVVCGIILWIIICMYAQKTAGC